MSQTASQRPKQVLVALFAVAVIAVVVFAFWRLSGSDDDKQNASATDSSSTSQATTAPTTATTTKATTAKPTPRPTGSCDGPTTQFNVEGIEQDSLLPDCGTAPVTRQQQSTKGLGLACGGSYPVILYKTTTSGAKTSICGKDASGASFRFVTKADDGAVIDMPGSYNPELDTFEARKSGTSYAVTAYDGTLLVDKGGSTSTQKSSEWISLDNESDYD